jgi:hypothetical protein
MPGSQEGTHSFFRKKTLLIVGLSALFSAWLFFTPEFSFAFEHKNRPLPQTPKSSTLSAVSVPSALGSVRETFTPAKNSSSTKTPFVIHIEDAHSSLEAQENIGRILKHLTKDRRFRTIYFEGGAGELDSPALRFFNNSKLNSQLIRLLATDGIAGGLELFLSQRLPRLRMVKAYGVEHPREYLQNLETFKSVLDQKTAVEQFIDQTRLFFLSNASNIFNSRLNSFFKEWLFHSREDGDLLLYLNFLSDYARKELNIDLTNPRHQLDWPMLVRIYKIKEFEAKIDPVAFSSEKNQFLLALRSSGVKPETVNRFQSIFQGAEQMDLRLFLEDFQTAGVAQEKLPFDHYPNLALFLGAAILRSEIESAALFEEAERFRNRILDRLVKTDTERNLLTVFNNLELLARLLKLELAPDEYEQVKSIQQELKPSALIERVKSFGGPQISNELKGRISPTDKVFSQALLFYDGALKREQTILDSMTEKMAELKESNAILITGGFHSPGLKRTLKDRNIAYAEISPRILEPADTKTYLKAMTNRGDYVTLRSHIRMLGLFEIAQFGALSGNAYLNATIQDRLGVLGADLGTVISLALNEINPRLKPEALQANLASVNASTAARRLGIFVTPSRPRQFSLNVHRLANSSRSELRATYTARIETLRKELTRALELAAQSTDDASLEGYQKQLARLQDTRHLVRNLAEFMNYLRTFYQPSNFQDELRQELAETYGFPTDQILFVPPTEIIFWELLRGNGRAGIDFDYTGSVISDSLSTVIAGEQNEPPQPVTGIRNDLGESATIALLVREAVKTRQTAGALRAATAIGPFGDSLMRGSHDYFVRKALIALAQTSSNSAQTFRTLIQKISLSLMSHIGYVLSSPEISSIPERQLLSQKAILFADTQSATQPEALSELEFAANIIKRSGEEPIDAFYRTGNTSALEKALGTPEFNAVIDFYNYWNRLPALQSRYEPIALRSSAFQIIYSTILNEEAPLVDAAKLEVFAAAVNEFVLHHNIFPNPAHNVPLGTLAEQYLSGTVQTADLPQKLVEVFVRSEIRTINSEEAALITQTSLPQESEMREKIVLKPEQTAVTRLTGGMWPDTLRPTQTDVNEFLAVSWPDKFSSSTRVEGNRFQGLLTSTKAQQLPLRVSIVFPAPPLTQDETLQALVFALSSDPSIDAQVVISNSLRSETLRLQQRLVNEVNKKRSELRYEQKGVKLTVTGGKENALIDFINEAPSRVLVLGFNRNELEQLDQSLGTRQVTERLLVFDNSPENVRGEVFIASVNAARNQLVLPRGIQNPWSLLKLTENMAIFERIQKFLKQSA